MNESSFAPCDMADEIKIEITAVGRALRPTNGEKHIHKVISVDAQGKVETVIEKELPQ